MLIIIKIKGVKLRFHTFFHLYNKPQNIFIMRKTLLSFLVIFALAGCSEYGDKSGLSESTADFGLSSGKYSGDGVSGPAAGDGQGQGGAQIEPGQITAGEWSDLANWNFWNNLPQKEEFAKMHEYWSYNLKTRISVQLKDKSSNKLINIPIQLLNSSDKVLWESMSDNDGKAELWASLTSNKTVEAKGLKLRIGSEVFENVIPFSEGVNQLTLNISEPSQPKKIDVAFMVDATGSMGDEMEYLKVELVDIINQVKGKNASAIINTGAVFYRDEGDDYVTRKSDFSTDLKRTVDFIKNQRADGGGDYPEAVHTALNVTLKDLQWSSNATSRIAFLVLDAPPHYEPQIVSDIHKSVVLASLKGIKLIPVTASGIDKNTEFLMRYMAIATNGTYVFITNHSGIGNNHIEPSIGEYEIEYLNQLIVRLINKYLE